MNMDLALLQDVLHDPRHFLGNRYVYAVISQRARGLSLGINLNPDQKCNFDCIYCEVKRSKENQQRHLDLKSLSRELQHLLAVIQLDKLQEVPEFANIPESLLQLKHVTLSGDGEPTCSPDFHKIVQEIVRIRSLPQFPNFKIVLITNGSNIRAQPVSNGLKFFRPDDEVWMKLDAGSQDYMQSVNRTDIPFTEILENILWLGRKRPIVIQSLFCCIDGEGPAHAEIERYVDQLLHLKLEGAQISFVQIYSVSRPPAHPGATHLRLDALSHIARRVREATGIQAEVF
jgi:wyosine [tRNA(Phe)-imidazoG37] synthetase (radical SAM superfamily)